MREADLGYAAVWEVKAGDFAPSLEKLSLRNQVGGLRIYPDFFRGLPELQLLQLTTNFLKEEDMHDSLFAGNELVELNLQATPTCEDSTLLCYSPGEVERWWTGWCCSSAA